MELPRLQTLFEKYRDQGFSVVAIESTHDTERSKRFAEENHLTFAMVEDDENRSVVSGVFGVNGFPTSYLVGRDGRVMFMHLGYDDSDVARYEQEILRLLQS